jgi:hypothetical protein
LPKEFAGRAVHIWLDRDGPDRDKLQIAAL